ncbi:MAG: trypsin-like serine protease [Nannocystaceae bacterium]
MSVFRLPSSVFRLPSSVFRLPSSVCRLPSFLRDRAYPQLAASVLGLAATACGDPLEQESSEEMPTAENSPWDADIARLRPVGADVSPDFEARMLAAMAMAEAPGGQEGKQSGILEMIQRAGSYTEALFLARLAAQPPVGSAPDVPDSLLEFSEENNWEFEGFYRPFGPSVNAELTLQLRVREADLSGIPQDERTQYFADKDKISGEMRALLRAYQGREISPREVLYVLINDDDTVWRRLKPQGWTRPAVTSTPGSSDSVDGSGVVPWEDREVLASVPESPADQMRGIIGVDTRTLRSRDNGHSMTGNTSGPIGALVKSTTNINPANGTMLDVSCSGTKVGARWVMTAGHCLMDHDTNNDPIGWSNKNRILFGADGVDHMENNRDASPNGHKNARARTLRLTYWNTKNRDYDFGVFTLYDNASSCSIPWRGVAQDSNLTGIYHLYGYPNETLQCAASPLSNGKCAGSIYGDDFTPASTGTYRVQYTVDTQPAQSGSGIYKYHFFTGTRTLHGVHTSGSSTSNSGVWLHNSLWNMYLDVKSDYPANAC